MSILQKIFKHFLGEHFRGYQYMDGTPYVTQCPILPGARFVYKFQARTTGTMFYHSHTSFQRGDGAFGPYIVRRTAETDPQTHLYDFDLTEHLIFPQEWFHMKLYYIQADSNSTICIQRSLGRTLIPRQDD